MLGSLTGRLARARTRLRLHELFENLTLPSVGARQPAPKAVVVRARVGPRGPRNHGLVDRRSP
jgi:hypothetical protein